MNKRTVTLASVLGLLLILFAADAATARQNYRSFYYRPEVRSMSLEQITNSKENCIECHSRVTPRVVSEHKSGIHFKKGLSCEACHGSDHAGMMVVTGKKACSKCHDKQTKEMLESKHSNSWYNSWKNPRYQVLSKAMRQQGCARCHDISYGMFDVKDVRCDYCHTSHQFSADQARSPLVCNTCHMGPDHPQAEAYQASGHGGVGDTPTCITCHQPKGTHNVSKNISIGGVSSGGVLDNWKWFMNGDGKPVMKRSVLTPNKFQKAREGTVAICSDCHDSNSAKQWLARADAQKIEAEKQLLTARNIIMELDKTGLLYPDPKTRPANPVEGQTLVLGGNQLYSGTSKAEAIYFKMFKFSGVGGWKSAYHQDFEGAEKINNQLLQLSGELKDEAKVLKILGKTQPVASDNNVKPVQDKVNFIIPGITGFLLGVILSVIILKLKKSKGLPFTSLLLIFIGTILAVSMFPTGALAWDGKGSGQQCASCHAVQYNKLKTGKHSGLQCLDCHSLGAGVAQVQKPETCGKCHSRKNGYQLEAYMSSPHGIKYRLSGANRWTPTCATCHMPKGDHSPLAGDPKKPLFESSIGKGCLGCHITDEMIKFSDDLEEINKTTDLFTADLKQTGLSLIDKGILVPDGGTENGEQLRNNWEAGKWKLVKQDQLQIEEQKLVQRLTSQLADKAREGMEASVKAKMGAAHVNPDYFHWYGNAFLNLDLSEAKGTADELERFATKAGFNGKETPGWQQLFAGICGIILGAAFSIGLIRKMTK